MVWKSSDYLDFIKIAKRLEKMFRDSPKSVKPSDLDRLWDKVQDYVLQETDKHVKSFEDQISRKYRERLPVSGVPRIFKAINIRYKTQWRQTLARSFSVAIDSVDNAGGSISIVSRLARFVSRLLGTNGVDTGWYVTGPPDVLDAKLAKNQSVTVEPGRTVFSSYVSARREARSRQHHVYIVDPPSEPESKSATVFVLTAPTSVINKHPSEPKAAELYGYARLTRTRSRRLVVKLSARLKMLFRTIPANIERELQKQSIEYFEARPIFRVVGGVVHNSASTCRWCNNKVLDRSGLEFVTRDPSLKDHLFHPNCRHRLVPVRSDFDGVVWSAPEIRRLVRNGNL